MDAGMNTPTPILMDIDQHAALPFPQSLPEFQRFPDDAACAEYLEKARWGDGFVCPLCSVTGEPFRIATRPGVLACRKCRGCGACLEPEAVVAVASAEPPLIAAIRPPWAEYQDFR